MGVRFCDFNENAKKIEHGVNKVGSDVGHRNQILVHLNGNFGYTLAEKVRCSFGTPNFKWCCSICKWTFFTVIASDYFEVQGLFSPKCRNGREICFMSQNNSGSGGSVNEIQGVLALYSIKHLEQRFFFRAWSVWLFHRIAEPPHTKKRKPEATVSNWISTGRVAHSGTRLWEKPKFNFLTETANFYVYLVTF